MVTFLNCIRPTKQRLVHFCETVGNVNFDVTPHRKLIFSFTWDQNVITK